MSRTYRRKKKLSNGWTDFEWYTSYRVYPWEDERSLNGYIVSIRVSYPKGSKEYKKGVARFHSDGETNHCKEPGPSWWRREYHQRPYRRDAKNELRKFVLDEEYEPMIDEMPVLDYWT